MPSPNVKINANTYAGVGRLSIPLATGTGNGDFVYVIGAPGNLTQWQANVKINGITYNAVKEVEIPTEEGSTAKYLCAAGTFTRYTVYPGSAEIGTGDFVKLLPGLVPDDGLYPGALLYPSAETMAAGLGADAEYADGVAMGDAKAGETVLVYIPKS